MSREIHGTIIKNKENPNQFPKQETAWDFYFSNIPMSKGHGKCLKVRASYKAVYDSAVLHSAR